MTLEQAIDKFFEILAELMDLQKAKDLMSERFIELQAEMHERQSETTSIQKYLDERTRECGELKKKYTDLRADLGSIQEMGRQVVAGESQTSGMEMLRRTMVSLQRIIAEMEGEE